MQRETGREKERQRGRDRERQGEQKSIEAETEKAVNKSGIFWKKKRMYLRAKTSTGERTVARVERWVWQEWCFRITIAVESSIYSCKDSVHSAEVLKGRVSRWLVSAGMPMGRVSHSLGYYPSLVQSLVPSACLPKVQCSNVNVIS